MGLIIVGFIIAVISEVFLIKFYNGGDKILSKYDAKHSDVLYSGSPEEFVNLVRSIPNTGISGVNFDGNAVSLMCDNTIYPVNFNNGVVSIEYDRAGCGLKISAIGKILKVFKVSKAVNKAVLINRVMDRISGKDSVQCESEYNKLRSGKKGFVISGCLAIVLMIIGACSLVSVTYDEAIDRVKSTEYSSDYTYGKLVEKYIKEPEWKAFESDKDTAVVEVNGTSIEGEKICIQFTGESGVGFSSVDTQEFKPYYFSVDGESIDAELGMAGIAMYFSN